MEKLSRRPQRMRRHSRKAWPPEENIHHERLTKRLFTPDIKRMLKEWLIRRRENPYPSREEKKRLAIQTGLTYTQICNWFANWRRKLKNSERRKQQSWGHLIKHYNTNARGNVEQFSISSEDSIWEEEHDADFYDDDDEDDELAYEAPNGAMPNESPQVEMSLPPSSQTNAAKYKHKMMEKYLRDMQEDSAAKTPTRIPMGIAAPTNTNAESKELTKWLESAAKFTPGKSNYSRRVEPKSK